MGFQSLRRAKNLLLSVVPKRLLLGVLCEEVDVEMEEETEKEAEDVESGRKALRAGREIEAVARSVPDLTDPDPDLRWHSHLILNS